MKCVTCYNLTQLDSVHCLRYAWHTGFSSLFCSCLQVLCCTTHTVTYFRNYKFCT